ncbi:aldehyde oxidoreductase [Desulfonema ishimotonii]|uniref:Aldehyde oxidoreductase n=1 Tax=Desulfonema ishimotonii TaxID=45657 RepID=A0A401FUP8_9BACT|nr:2Fe-2S iron-sulfur cluster-binding protein [Desulfonema ishimotonii]GBC60685.1 aldehyde oxidoreductase [Desulfonema ishimotonii]
MAQFKKKTIRVNGVPKAIIAEPDMSLAEIIRSDIGLTGTKVGCNKGQCGSCNVILNGKLTRSCITRWEKVPDDSEVTTIEGLGTVDNLHPVQWAFVVTGAIQCGFCTPGFIISAKALLDQNPNPSRQDIRDWFQKYRNACRCTGYVQIVDAVMAAAAVLRGEKKADDFSTLMGDKGNIWGTAYPRPSAVCKATGTWDFGEDYRNRLPDNTLFAAVVRAEVSHALVRGVDTAEAEQMEGVSHIVTAKDIRGDNRLAFQTEGCERPILCDKKICQYGDPIAIVCADTEKNARAAAKKVRVETEDLPAYMNAPDAIAEGAVRIHEGVSNLYQTLNVRKGEETAPLMEKAAVTVADEFYLQRQPHMPMEPDVGFGYMDEEGRLTIHSKSIWIFFHAAQMAPGLGLEPNQIRIVENGVGGTFGYKLSLTCEPLIGAEPSDTS